MTRALLVGWRACQRGSLVGFARIRFPDLYSAEISDIAVHVSGRRRWATPPARPWAEDGRLITDPRTGKPQYQAVIHFPTHGARKHWSDAVIAAVRAKHPALLPDGDDDDQLSLFGEVGP
jgi:hypothetical protein